MAPRSSRSPSADGQRDQAPVAGAAVNLRLKTVIAAQRAHRARIEGDRSADRQLRSDQTMDEIRRQMVERDDTTQLSTTDEAGSSNDAATS
jgi:hypothetical protein